MCQGAAAPLETPGMRNDGKQGDGTAASRPGLRRGRGTFCESVITHHDTFCLPAESSKVPWAKGFASGLSTASKSRAFRGYTWQIQAFAERIGLRPSSLQGTSPCILRRRCRPAPGSKTGSHAFDGMASCFVRMMRSGAFWCRRGGALRGISEMRCA